MILKLTLAVVVGGIVTLVCIFIGSLLVTMPVSWVVALGAFLHTYAALLGLLAALYHYFSDGTWFKRA
jgi:hypothetical protein